MGKRIAFGFVVVLIFMLPSTAALAAPATGHGRNTTSPGQARKSAGSTATPNNGHSHAPKGTNGPGAHGKSLRHTPVPGSAPQEQPPADPAHLSSGTKWHHDKYVCSHGDSNKPCRPDPQPDHGRDCSHPHFVINQDHCLGSAPPTVPPPVTPPVTPPGKGPKVLPLPKITRVLNEKTLPNTGVDAIDLSYAGLALLIAGQFLRKRARTIPR